jgi:hypothetical protein
MPTIPNTIPTFASVCAAALVLSACTPPRPHIHGDKWNEDHWSIPKTVTRLDCPDSQGDLTRKSAAADGRSCIYNSSGGADVTLQLVDLTGGDADATLGPIAAQLRAELPAAPPKAAETDTAAQGDRVDIDLPGVHIHTHGNGADVDAPGVNVKADDNGAHVNIRKPGAGGDKVSIDSDHGRGAVSIDANDNGAEVRVEDGSGPGVRKMFIATSDAAGPHGYRLAGYEARGPSAGPLVVALVKSKSEDHDNLYHDVRELLRQNVGS